MLVLNNVEVLYDGVILVLKGLSMGVDTGQTVALLGANGAGKSTTLKAISGLLATEEGEVSRGTVTFEGERIDRLEPSEIVRRGIVHVLEGRRVFPHLDVEENLRAGAHLRHDGRVHADLERVYHHFPRLQQRRRQKAGYLSGGEQQMLAIGRALMARPRLLMLDEPSLGLSPLIVKEILEILRGVHAQEHVTLLLVEQNARAALSIADFGYVLEAGRIVLEGPALKLRENEEVREFYLGYTEQGQRRNYRAVKRYRRRKRWLA